ALRVDEGAALDRDELTTRLWMYPVDFAWARSCSGRPRRSRAVLRRRGGLRRSRAGQEKHRQDDRESRPLKRHVGKRNLNPWRVDVRKTHQGDLPASTDPTPRSSRRRSKSGTPASGKRSSRESTRTSRST